MSVDAEGWVQDELKKQGYQYNHMHLIEVYSESPDENGKIYNWEYWISCNK